MKTHQALSVVALAIAPILAATSGCITYDDVVAQSDNVSQRSGYEMNVAKTNHNYPDAFPIVKPADAWTAKVTLGGQTLDAPTHLFGPIVNVIPYANQDEVEMADGKILARGDQVVAEYFKPGQVGIGLKMHRPEKRSIDLDNADATRMKEDFKLQDTHIELVVGVERAEHGFPGAITLNNPQNYESGRFGDKKYSMIFLRPELPQWAAPYSSAYMDNVRLALVGFNAVTDFPGDYNGGDPLGGRNPDKVREYVDQMVRAIAGDEDARSWFTLAPNQVYCAELAFLALTAGVIQPLNARSMVPRVGESVWQAFEDQVALHNAGVDALQAGEAIATPSEFLALNANKRVGMVRINTAADDLPAIAELSPSPEQDRDKLALLPMTMSDIVEQFMRTHIPREVLGEALAPLQGGALAKMKPGLLETMGMDQFPEADPRRVAVEMLFDEIVAVVATSFDSYDQFRAAIEPLLAQARQVTGPRDDSGEGLFVPPSLFHVAAQGKHRGLFSMQYEGHGLHASIVQATALPAPTPLDNDDLAATGTCADRCGGFDSHASCQCDARCSNYGDCCNDYASVCQ